MYDKSCPRCDRPSPRQLREPSDHSPNVNYFRCDGCAHVWTATKDGARLVAHLTVYPDERPERKHN